MYIRIFSISLLLCLFCFSSCKQDPKPTAEVVKPRVKVPSFNADSSYNYVAKQLEFGVRVPGTESHKACKEWFIEKFESFGADVISQDFTAEIYTGDKWPASNIIARFNPKKKDRVILSAHWDSRFIAEEDPEKDRKDDPIPGADDGASGVGVLLEIGRVIKNNPIDLGVDIILWDAEDQGERGNSNNDWWCLGSQHWARNQHVKNYKAKWGINLDMVGAKNPTFCQDEVSRVYAPQILNN